MAVLLCSLFAPIMVVGFVCRALARAFIFGMAFFDDFSRWMEDE